MVLHIADNNCATSTQGSAEQSNVNALLKQAHSLRYIDIKQAISLCDKAISLSARINYPLGIACAIVQKSSYHFSLAEYDVAFQLAHEALERFKAIEDDFGKAFALKVIGCVYVIFSQPKQALQQFLASLSLLLPLPEEHLLGEKSIEIGTVVMNIGTSYFHIQDYEQALSYYLKAFEYHKASNHVGGMADCAANLGGLYITLKEPQKAIEWLERTIDYCKDTRKPNAQIAALVNLSNVYQTLGECDKALRLLQESIEIADNSDERSYLHLSYKSLSDIYEAFGDYKQALLCHKKYVEFSEQHFGKHMEQKIKALETKFADDEAKKSAQLAAQNEKIKQLEEMVTICAWSGRIKMDNKWVRVEEFLQKKFGFKISHGITEEMAEKLRQQYHIGKSL